MQGRRELHEDSEGHIAARRSGEMMSLDPCCVCVFTEVSEGLCTCNRLITSGMSGWGYDCICIDFTGVEVARNAKANQSQSSRLASTRRCNSASNLADLI